MNASPYKKYFQRDRSVYLRKQDYHTALIFMERATQLAKGNEHLQQLTITQLETEKINQQLQLDKQAAQLASEFNKKKSQTLITQDSGELISYLKIYVKAYLSKITFGKNYQTFSCPFQQGRP